MNMGPQEALIQHITGLPANPVFTSVYIPIPKEKQTIHSHILGRYKHIKLSADFCTIK